MRIAILGWGSLLWDPGNLCTKGEWHSDGPWLPIEFARISGKKQDRLTLVLMEGVEPVQTYWVESCKAQLDEARENLRIREETGSAGIGYVKRNGCTWSAPFPELESRIRDWMQSQAELDTVIWTDLRSNFKEKAGKDFSVENALVWLQKLINEGRQTRAKEYIRRAPAQTDTLLRRHVRKALGWTDRGLNE